MTKKATWKKKRKEKERQQQQKDSSQPKNCHCFQLISVTPEPISLYPSTCTDSTVISLSCCFILIIPCRI